MEPRLDSTPIITTSHDDASARRRESPAMIAFGLAVLFHLLVDLVLVVGRWYWYDLPLYFLLSIPFAQTSLAALWSGTRAMPSYAKFAVALVATGWTWYVTIVVLPDRVLGSIESAGWAIALGAQATMVLAGVAAWSIRQEVLAARDRSDAPVRRWHQYGIGTLLAWTTVAAVLLGLGQTALLRSDFASGSFEWPLIRFLLLIGLFNAAYALLVLLSLIQRRRVVFKIVIAVVFVAAAASVEPLMLRLLFGTTGGFHGKLAWILAGTQVAVLYATLLPVTYFAKQATDPSVDDT